MFTAVSARRNIVRCIRDRYQKHAVGLSTTAFLGVGVTILFVSTLWLWRLGNPAEFVVSDRDVYLATGPLPARALVGLGSRDGSEALRVFEDYARDGRILKIRAGTRVKTLEYGTLTAGGIAPPVATNGSERNMFPVKKLKVLDGAHAGLQGWVLAVDVNFHVAPLP